MFFLWNIVALTLLLSCFVKEAVGLKCYECIDKTNLPCSPDLKKNRIVECGVSDLSTMYSSQYQQIFGLLNNNKIVEEASTISNKKWSCAKVTVINSIQVPFIVKSCVQDNGICEEPFEKYNLLNTDIKCCDTNLCNSSFKTNAEVFTLSLCIFFVILLWKINM